MSILKNNLRSSGSSVQSGARSTNSKIINWVCAAFIAGLIFLGSGGAKADPSYPYNALVNPGAETGDLTGWNHSLTGYHYVVSTNGAMNGVTNGIISTNQMLAHSGKYAFQLFDTTTTSSYIWQDYPARVGSQWSANCFAICYASNYFSTAIAYMEVAFFDTNGNVLDDPSDPFYGNNGSGVYGSAILDPIGATWAVGWIITPPPAFDTNGWMYLPATNFYYGYTNNPNNPPIEPGPAGYGAIEYGFEAPVASTLIAPAGTAFVRYKLEFDNSSTGGGDVYWDDCQLNKLNQTDPDLTNPQPASVTIYAGQKASFTVNALSDLRLNSGGHLKAEDLFYQWQKNGTNLQAQGGAAVGNSIQGATTNTTLSLTNCLAGDAGMYSCLVFDSPVGNGLPTGGVTNYIRSVPANLTVLVISPYQKANVLGPNAGFESAPNWDPWEPFNGCASDMATNVYGTSTTPVNIFDGNWVALVGNNGDRDNGFHHQWAATPGSTWKAGGWAYLSSLNDLPGGNTCRLQIWFKDASGASLSSVPPYTPTFESFKIYGWAYTNADMEYTNVDQSSANLGQVMYHTQLPRDTWCYLAVSNVTTQDGVRLTNDIPHGTWTQGYFNVPTNVEVAQINFQVYEYCPQSTDNGIPGGYLGTGTGGVYWDDMQLIQVLPATNITASVSGGNFKLSFFATAGLSYNILYKDNLTNATWSLLTNVAAPWEWQTNVNSCATSTSTDTATNVPVFDPITTHRFYRVQAQ